MTRPYAKAVKHAKSGSDARVGIVRRAHRSADEIVGKRRRAPASPLVDVARAIWPTKTAYWWAHYAGVDPRRAEDWLSGAGSPSADAKDAMLRGDHGLEFLEGMMGGQRPAWFRHFTRQIEISKVRAEQECTRRRLEALERGEE